MFVSVANFTQSTGVSPGPELASGGGNGEFQVYTPDSANSYCQNGNLYIKATRLMDNRNPWTGQPFGEGFLSNGILDLGGMYGYCTNDANDGCYRDANAGEIMPSVMSARLRSWQKFSFVYGRVEVRARMPKGDWLWPAIWMLPEDWAYGGWPRSGEIDIVESRGNRDLKIDGSDIGVQEAASTLHWGPGSDQNRFRLTTNARKNFANDYGNSFHLYELDWSTNGLRFTLDGETLLDVPDPLISGNPSWSGFWNFGGPWNPGTTNPWANADFDKLAPFDKRFHFILNVAVGGTSGMFPDNVVNSGGPKPWSNGDPNAPRTFWNAQGQWYPTWQWDSTMEIDYIRVYQQV